MQPSYQNTDPILILRNSQWENRLQWCTYHTKKKLIKISIFQGVSLTQCCSVLMHSNGYNHKHFKWFSKEGKKNSKDNKGIAYLDKRAIVTFIEIERKY